MEFYTNFRLGNRTLEDFGNRTTIMNDGGAKVQMFSNISQNTVDIGNRSSIYQGSTPKSKPISFNVAIKDKDFDKDAFASWLYNNGQEQEFQYDGDDKYLNVVLNYSNPIDVQLFTTETREQGLIIPISFVAHDPYWKIKNEKSRLVPSPQLNEKVVFKGRNNVDSFPLIRIKPSANGKVRFKWNDDMLILTDLESTKEYFIDSEEGIMYYLQAGRKIPCMDLYYYDDYYSVPILKPFVNNSFELIEGTLAEVEIWYKSRIYS